MNSCVYLFFYSQVVDVKTNEALGPNEEGEICVRGAMVMKGYLNNEEATSNTIDADGWLHTGDIGYYDQDGFFFITDRLKELIKYKVGNHFITLSNARFIYRSMQIAKGLSSGTV